MVLAKFLSVSLLLGFVKAKFDPVAFTVAHSSSTAMNGVETVPYAKVITVHNTLTNISKGVFTCTREGYYKFQVYATSYNGGRVFLEIYGNNTLLASLYGHTNSDYATAGNAVIVYLRVGDTVQVKTKGTFPVTLYNSYNANTFTGVELGSDRLYSSPGEPYAIAFSVVSNHHQNVQGGAAVQYHTKLVDDNDAFDLDKGTYTSPSSGYYIIHFFSMARQNEELWQDLSKNGNYVCSIYAYTDYEWADAGNTVILHLAEGDNLTLSAHEGLENHLYGTDDHIFTTFSGAQIISDSDLSNPDTEPIVLFSIGLSTNLTVASSHYVLFDKVFVDMKGTYNVTGGVFVAPVTGFYEFNYHAVAEKGSTVNLRLVRNGSVINEIYTHDLKHRPSGGNAAVLELSGGDVLGIRAFGTNHLIGGSKEIFCTFSGYLLSATGPSAIIGK